MLPALEHVARSAAVPMSALGARMQRLPDAILIVDARSLSGEMPSNVHVHTWLTFVASHAASCMPVPVAAMHSPGAERTANVPTNCDAAAFVGLKSNLVPGNGPTSDSQLTTEIGAPATSGDMPHCAGWEGRAGGCMCAVAG